LNIPHDQIQNHVDELKKYKLLYIHCRSGARAAAAAAQTLAKAGFGNVVDDWIASGFPVYWKRMRMLTTLVVLKPSLVAFFQITRLCMREA